MPRGLAAKDGKLSPRRPKKRGESRRHYTSSESASSETSRAFSSSTSHPGRSRSLARHGTLRSDRKFGGDGSRRVEGEGDGRRLAERRDGRRRREAPSRDGGTASDLRRVPVRRDDYVRDRDRRDRPSDRDRRCRDRGTDLDRRDASPHWTDRYRLSSRRPRNRGRDDREEESRIRGTDFRGREACGDKVCRHRGADSADRRKMNSGRTEGRASTEEDRTQRPGVRRDPSLERGAGERVQTEGPPAEKKGFGRAWKRTNDVEKEKPEKVEEVDSICSDSVTKIEMPACENALSASAQSGLETSGAPTCPEKIRSRESRGGHPVSLEDNVDDAGPREGISPKAEEHSLIRVTIAAEKSGRDPKSGRDSKRGRDSSGSGVDQAPFPEDGRPRQGSSARRTSAPPSRPRERSRSPLGGRGAPGFESVEDHGLGRNGTAQRYNRSPAVSNRVGATARAASSREESLPRMVADSYAKPGRLTCSSVQRYGEHASSHHRMDDGREELRRTGYFRGFNQSGRAEVTQSPCDDLITAGVTPREGLPFARRPPIRPLSPSHWAHDRFEDVVGEQRDTPKRRRINLYATSYAELVVEDVDPDREPKEARATSGEIEVSGGELGSRTPTPSHPYVFAKDAGQQSEATACSALETEALLCTVSEGVSAVDGVVKSPSASEKEGELATEKATKKSSESANGSRDARESRRDSRERRGYNAKGSREGRDARDRRDPRYRERVVRGSDG